MTKKEALLLIGHGSKLIYSKNLIIELANKLRKKKIFSGEIFIGLMEFNNPTIPEGIANAINSGAKKIIVIPVFLASGIHTTRDIPNILNLKIESESINYDSKNINDSQCIKKHSNHNHVHISSDFKIPNDVEIIYKKPLGPDDKIVDIIIDRLFEQ